MPDIICDARCGASQDVAEGAPWHCDLLTHPPDKEITGVGGGKNPANHPNLLLHSCCKDCSSKTTKTKNAAIILLELGRIQHLRMSYCVCKFPPLLQKSYRQIALLFGITCLGLQTESSVWLCKCSCLQKLEEEALRVKNKQIYRDLFCPRCFSQKEMCKW